jgi:photosystem II stability/assembly factor-like uncharacterized protein
MQVLRAWFASTICLLLLICVPAPARGSSMQLLTQDKGWVLSNRHLFWTADNGSHWKDITPRAVGFIDAVFFLDTSRGWVLFSDGDEKSNLISFRLASTTDSGQTWAITPVKVPSQKPEELDGRTWLNFVDPLRGWMVLRANSSSAFSWGLLLKTDNGGKSWKELPQAPAAGQPVFATAHDGWISGPGWAGMFSTHDGGKTWGGGPSLEDLPPSMPAPGYGDVKFINAKHGFLPIWLQAAADAEEPRGTALALYVTEDGGRTWKRDRTLIDRGAFTKDGAALSRIGASTVVPDHSGTGWTLLVAFNDRKHLSRVALMTVGNQGEVTTDAAPSVTSENVLWRPGDDVAELSFTSSVQGWVRTALGDLLLTVDGGATWKNIGPAQRPVAPAINFPTTFRKFHQS